MVDHGDIATGADLEILVGPRMLEKVAHALQDAGVLPPVLEFNEVRVELGRASAVRFVDEARFNVEVDVPFVAHLGPERERQRNLANTITLRLQAHGGTNARLTFVEMGNFRSLTYDHVGGNKLAPLLMGLVHALADVELPLLDGSYFRSLQLRVLPPGEGGHSALGFYGVLDMAMHEPFEVDLDAQGRPVFVHPLLRGPVDVDPARAINFLPEGRDLVVGLPRQIYQRMTNLVLNGLLEPIEVLDEGALFRWLGPHWVAFLRNVSDEVVAAVERVAVVPDAPRGLELKLLLDPYHDGASIPLAPDAWWVFDLDLSIEDGRVEQAVSMRKSLHQLLVEVLDRALEGAFGIDTGIDFGDLDTATDKVRDNFVLIDQLPSVLELSAGKEVRVDAFRRSEARVALDYRDMRIDEGGMHFAAVARSEVAKSSVPGVRLIGRERASEPQGDLLGLTFQVPRPSAIPVPRKASPPLDEVGQVVSVAEVKRAVAEGVLAPMALVPTDVRRVDETIREIWFSGGAAFSPAEARDLEEAGAVRVERLVWVDPPTGKGHYRARPDGDRDNNLESMPEYEAWEGRYLVGLARTAHRRVLHEIAIRMVPRWGLAHDGVLIDDVAWSLAQDWGRVTDMVSRALEGGRITNGAFEFNALLEAPAGVEPLQVLAAAQEGATSVERWLRLVEADTLARQVDAVGGALRLGTLLHKRFEYMAGLRGVPSMGPIYEAVDRQIVAIGRPEVPTLGTPQPTQPLVPVNDPLVADVVERP